MRYHGNYCGPNWSAGKHQPSVVSDVEAIDEFDETCKVHDAAYYYDDDLESADYNFAAENLFSLNPKRVLAGALVGIQGVSRTIDRLTNTKLPRMNQPKSTKVNLRGAGAPQTGTKRANPQVTTVAIPAAIGSIIRGKAHNTVRKDQTSISLSVSVCLGRPAAATQAGVPELQAIQYLNPVSVGNDEIQNMTRVYQRYRIRSATVDFKAFQGTTVGGEVLIVSNDDPNYRPVNTATASSFYQKSLATDHTLMTPIWMSTSMQLAVDNGWKVCDNSNSTTLEEFCSGVMYIYEDGATSIAGFYLLHLDIDFEGLRFNPRSLISGSFQGLGTRISSTAPAPTLGANGTLTIAGATIGDVYALVLSTTGATFGVGITASTLFALSSGSGTIAFTITGSTLLYARATSTTSVDLFATYDSAVGSDVSDRLLFGVTTITTSTFPVTVLTQLRNSTQPGA